MSLRPYQAKLKDDIYAQWQQGDRSVLAQAPTGSGKTHLFSDIATDITSQGGRVLVLAHREELITQAHGKLTAATGAEAGIIKSGYNPRYDLPIQVASVQSLVNRLDKTGPFDLVVCDEAHRSVANTYRRILAQYPSALQLGVTATPIRSDGSGFDDIYDSLVCGPTTGELIQLGHLSPYRLIADAKQMTTAGVRTQAGDFNTKQLAAANDAIQLSGNVVQSYFDHCYGKKTIVFAINCEHSRAIAHAYDSAGIAAAHLDGNSTPEERAETLRRFAAGELWVLSNVGLFVEGFDLPSLEAVQIARPTKSLGLWLQMLGRGLRTAPGKAEATLIDHTDNWKRLGTPTRPRLWTLDGVQVEPRQVTRNEKGEVVESEPITIEETPIHLAPVVLDPLEEWRAVWLDMVDRQKQRGYKPSWLGFQLAKIKPTPPLEVWEMAAAYLGYRKGWAFYQHKAQQEAIAA